MSLLNKIKFHVETTAQNKSLRYVFYQMLHIINRRSIIPSFIKHVIFLDSQTSIGSEKHLENYMFPKHNGCFIDIGANVGLWTFYLAKKGIKVHAFEPHLRTYKILKKRIKKLDVHAHLCALGEKHEMGNLNVHYNSGHNSFLTKLSDFCGYQTEVIIKTLDEFKFENVGLIKIDTEGYEIPVLLGARRTILKEKPRLIIEVHLQYKEQLYKIEDILIKLNYKWIKRYKRKLKGLINIQFHIIADSRS